MKDYLAGDVFDPPKKAFVYLERKTALGRMRKGLVAQIDLETYEWKPFSKANIRATDGFSAIHTIIYLAVSLSRCKGTDYFWKRQGDCGLSCVPTNLGIQNSGGL